jgi:hypothetical protein
VIRLINPTLLLTLGMQARNPNISLLLWTMGLDAIVSTSDAAKFRRRLSKLLGESQLFMPRSEFFGQPEYEAGKMAEEIYTLRGIIAHGNEIPARFRDHVGFKVVGATSTLPQGWETWTYSYVLSQLIPR